MSGQPEQELSHPTRPVPSDAIWTNLTGFGLACAGEGWRVRVRNEDEVMDLFGRLRGSEIKVAFRGSGASYGDAALNTGELVCDCTAMNRILDWNRETGVIHVEGGVTIEQIWRHVIADGYWPPVVSGTMTPTIAGALAMNIHGKNCFVKGPIGDHVLDLRLLTPRGEAIDCSPAQRPEVFEAAITSFGMLGYIASARLKLTRIHSGKLAVRAFCTRDMKAMFACFEEHIPSSDYLVGWIDGFAAGRKLGRGIVHSARYMAANEDLRAQESLKASAHELPRRLFKVIPKRWIWRFLKPFANRLGMKLISALKYRMSWLFDRGKVHHQTLGGFNFLLDFVPDWRKVYLPGGFIQHQTFLPKETACEGFARILEICHRHKIPPYLVVFKRHRPDRFLMTHGLDGFSLALDFPIARHSRGRIVEMTAEIDALVCSLGGRFYPAKDATLKASHYRLSMPVESMDRFVSLKQTLDPENRLESDLYRRLFEDGPHNSGILKACGK